MATTYERRQQKYKASREKEEAKRQDKIKKNQEVAKKLLSKNSKIKYKNRNTPPGDLVKQAVTKNYGSITEIDVWEIKNYMKTGNFSIGVIAKHYRKKVSTITKVLNGHISGIPCIFQTNRLPLFAFPTPNQVKMLKDLESDRKNSPAYIKTSELRAQKSIDKLNKQFDSNCATIRSNGLSVPNGTVPTPERDI